MLEHTQGWSTKYAGDSTGGVGAGVQTEMGEEGLQVGWKGQGWDEPSANMHQQWDEERGAGTRSGEQVCWEQRPQDSGSHLLPSWEPARWVNPQPILGTFSVAW